MFGMVVIKRIVETLETPWLSMVHYLMDKCDYETRRKIFLQFQRNQIFTAHLDVSLSLKRKVSLFLLLICEMVNSVRSNPFAKILPHTPLSNFDKISTYCFKFHDNFTRFCEIQPHTQSDFEHGY